METTGVELAVLSGMLFKLAGSLDFCAAHHRLPGKRRVVGGTVWSKVRLPSAFRPQPSRDRRSRIGLTGMFALGLLLLLAYSHSAEAIPSFSRQTGFACAMCHTQAFGPNLTPLGRAFKREGYTRGNGGDGPLTKGIPPLSGMLMGSFTHTQRGQAPQPTTGPSAPTFNSNDNFALDQASLFYGGRLYGPAGAFAQFTYDGVANTVHVDNIDLRVAHKAELWGHPLDYGVTLNNNPTVQDLWNTTPAWSFPFASSPLAPTPSAGQLIANLGQQVGGGSLYAMVDDHLYLEAGAYGDFSVDAQKGMGVWAPDNPSLTGGAPYWRLVLQHEWEDQYAALGTYGLRAQIYPDRLHRAFGTDSTTDLGVDLTYQYLGNMRHIFELRGAYARESRTLAASRAVGAATRGEVMLDTLNLNASYTFAQTYTGSFGFFHTTGNRDPVLYAGFAGLRPDSQYFISEFAYVPFGKTASFGLPWLNLRFAVQYVAYTHFNGARRHAEDNNTLFVSGWLAF